MEKKPPRQEDSPPELFDKLDLAEEFERAAQARAQSYFLFDGSRPTFLDAIRNDVFGIETRRRLLRRPDAWNNPSEQVEAGSKTAMAAGIQLRQARLKPGPDLARGAGSIADRYRALADALTCISVRITCGLARHAVATGQA